MAECNYDEVTHSVYPPENPDPMYHWDAHFLERLSRLHLSLEFSSPVFPRSSSSSSSRRARERSTGRYKTQPITFDEIKEVDEDSTAAAAVQSTSSAVSTRTPQDSFRESSKTSFFRNQIPGFSRSVDGLLASRGCVLGRSGASTESDKENTPCHDHHPAGDHILPDLGLTEEEEEEGRKSQAYSVLEGGMVAPPDVIRHRRKRSGRRLRKRNTVPEEVPETEKME